MTDKQKKFNWPARVRDLAIVFLLIVLVHWWQTRDMAAGPAPDLTGQMLSGERASLEDFRGQPVLVHFWATWCPICRTVEDSIESLAADYRVLTVATGSGNAGELRKYMESHDLSFPVMLDEEGRLGRSWGVRGVPSSFIIDADGNIRSVAMGYTTALGLRFRLWLAGD